MPTIFLLGAVIGLVFFAVIFPVIEGLSVRLAPPGDLGLGFALTAVLVAVAVALLGLLFWKLAPLLVPHEAYAFPAFVLLLVSISCTGLVYFWTQRPAR